MDAADTMMCTRCGRRDLDILSNGYCTRCDEVLFGYHAPPSMAPSGWPEPTFPQIVLGKGEVD